jgi:D-hexose-6-phosphate mutarotase
MITQLQENFEIPGLRFETGAGGLIKAVIDTPSATGEVYLHGAHVTAYQPRGSKPIVWMSGKSLFEESKPIRGGVPICFPWFGAHASDPTTPAHGSARIRNWDFLSAASNIDGSLTICLGKFIDGFSVEFSVAIGDTLTMALKVSLSTDAIERQCYEAALHTYFSVSDIHAVSIEGLESSDYIDKVGGTTPRTASGEAIRFASELDRVYQNTDATCILRDPGFNRSIDVAKSNSRSTIVWNPWIAKSARMPDFGDDEWMEMLCIETANVGENAVVLSAGQSHVMTAVISVEALK